MTTLYEQVCSPGNAPPRMFEPRRIVPPGGYHSPKLVAASLFTILGENGLKLRANEFIAPTAITAQEIAYEVTNNSVPIYYVSDALSRAVAATELPSGIKIEDLNWPMPALVLGFPQRFMLEYERPTDAVPFDRSNRLSQIALALLDHTRCTGMPGSILPGAEFFNHQAGT